MTSPMPDRDPSPPLHVERIGEACPFVDISGHADSTAQEQQILSHGSLAGIDVREDTKIAILEGSSGGTG